MHNLNNSYDVDVDEYREVINGDKTYNTIDNSISEFYSAIIHTILLYAWLYISSTTPKRN